MSKIRQLVEARRVELLEELAECDAFLGDQAPPAAAITPTVEQHLAAVTASYSPPMARPRGATESVLDAALNGATRIAPNGLPLVNPNDRLVTDPSTGSVIRQPNGATG